MEVKEADEITDDGTDTKGAIANTDEHINVREVEEDGLLQHFPKH